MIKSTFTQILPITCQKEVLSLLYLPYFVQVDKNNLYYNSNIHYNLF